MGRKTPPFSKYPQWTEARFWGFIRSLLRQGSRRWPPIYEAKKEARRPSRGSNKRQKWEYQCAECKNWFPDKQVEIDHIEEVGTLKNYEDLPGFVERLFCSKDELRVICKECHKRKTYKK